MTPYILSLLLTLAATASHSPDYKITAIRYATILQFPAVSLVMGAPEDEKLDIAMVFWLIRGNGRNILFDCGNYREKWHARFAITEYMRPDSVVQLAGT